MSTLENYASLSFGQDPIVHLCLNLQGVSYRLTSDIMASYSAVSVGVNNFSKRTRPRDILLLLKDTLSIEDDKLSKACRSVCAPELSEERYPHQV